MRFLQGLPGVLRLDVEAVHVVQPAVGGLAHHRAGPGLKEGFVLDLPVDDGIAHDADAVGVGETDGTFQEAALLHPGGAGDLAVAVEGEPASANRVVVVFATRVDDGDAGADGLAADDGGITDLDACRRR